jgi:hypothetical protein
MKKILLILTLMLITTPAMATNQGWGGRVNCIPSTQTWDSTLPKCGDTEDIFHRIYDLEGTVAKLELQINQLQTTCNNQSTVQTAIPSDNPSITLLENRITKIESALTFIQTTVVQAFSTTIGLLQKLITKQ